MKTRILAVCALSCLMIGGALVVIALPGGASDPEVAAARQAQAEWSARRSQELINRKPWNGVHRPGDAVGTPLDRAELAGGIAALAIAAAFAVAAGRARRYC